MKLSVFNALQQKSPFYLSKNTAFCLSEFTHTHTQSNMGQMSVCEYGALLSQLCDRCIPLKFVIK